MFAKRILLSALAAVCAASLLVPAAYAYGGCRGRGSARTAAPYRCAVCTVEGCTLTGRHYHDGVLYCGYSHANGWCDGACLPLCEVEGCTLTGRHYHDGTLYCGADHAAGYCAGNCPLYQAPANSGAWYGGRHGCRR